MTDSSATKADGQRKGKKKGADDEDEDDDGGLR